jgi:hypothetical protein
MLHDFLKEFIAQNDEVLEANMPDRENFGKSCLNGSGRSASFGLNAQPTSAPMVAICCSAMRRPCGRQLHLDKSRRPRKDAYFPNDCRGAVTSILGGLHHEYRLEGIAA